MRMRDKATRDGGNLRVAIVQPALPRYRLPAFIALSERDGIELSVLYEEVANLTNVDPGGLSATATRAHRVKTPMGPLLWSPAQWRMASREKCDVLVLNWNTRYLSLLPALLRARRKGVPTLLWGHGYSLREGRVRGWLRRAMTRLSTAVVFYDQATAKDHVERGGSIASTFVAQNAIDQAPIASARKAWTSDAARLSEFRRDHELRSGPVIAFVARLEPYKRLDLLLSAVATLSQDFPDLKAILIGGGDSEQSMLENQADRLGIGDRIRFLGSIYREDELAPWLLTADVMVIPGAIGLSVLTAFGFGLPIVANDDSGANGPEWQAIEPGVNGLLFESGSPDSLAQTLRRMFEDPEVSKTLATGALRTAHQDYTLELMVDGLESAIKYCAHAELDGRSQAPGPFSH